MNRHRANLCWFVTVFILAAAAARRWQTAVPQLAGDRYSIVPFKARAADTLDSALDEAVDLLVSNDPFRLSNEPSSVRFDPKGEVTSGSAQAIAPVHLRPALRLEAIVGGPPWQAIVEGIPGQAGPVTVQAGATFDKISVASVTRDSVILNGPDTSWVLGFRRQP